VSSYALNDLLLEMISYPRNVYMVELADFEENLNISLDHAEAMLDAYSRRQHLSVADLSIVHLRHLLRVLAVLPPFKDLGLSDKTAIRIRRF
jgi:hypothetical protein